MRQIRLLCNKTYHIMIRLWFVSVCIHNRRGNSYNGSPLLLAFPSRAFDWYLYGVVAVLAVDCIYGSGQTWLLVTVNGVEQVSLYGRIRNYVPDNDTGFLVLITASLRKSMYSFWYWLFYSILLKFQILHKQFLYHCWMIYIYDIFQGGLTLTMYRF